MKNKTTIGLGLLALAAAAAWYWWRQRSATATDAASATPDSPFGAKQIGSNFSTDITPDVVALAFGYSQQVIADAKPCWAFYGKAGDGFDTYCPQGSNNPNDCTHVVAGTFPRTGRVC